MKVNIDSPYTHTKAHKAIAFKAGHTTIISDFDGTYMPATFDHSVVVSKKGYFDSYDYFEYFSKFQKLFSGLKDKCEFILSSGRNIYETEFFFKNLPNPSYVPKPDYFISSNGSDILERDGDGFSYKRALISKQKESDITTLSGWDTEKIKGITRSILKNEGFEVIESKVNSNKQEYGEFSSEANIERLKTPYSNKVASIRQDEHLHLNVAFTKDSDEQTILTTLKKIEDTLTNSGIKANYSFNSKNPYAGNQRIIELTPRIKYLTGEEGSLSKLYDPLLRIQSAAKNNDLIIVAGDSSNDKPMLNLINYFKKNMQLTQKDMDNLPVISIIVENKNSKITSLKNELAKFNHDSIKKMIVVNPNGSGDVKTLHEAIELAIKSYSDQNNSFAKGLIEGASPELIDKLGIKNIKDNFSLIKNKKIFIPLSLAGASLLAIGSTLSNVFNKLPIIPASRIGNPESSIMQTPAENKMSQNVPKVFSSFDR